MSAEQLATKLHDAAPWDNEKMSFQLPLWLRDELILFLTRHDGPSRGDWINVKERLPAEVTEVLLCHIIDDHAKTIDIAWQKGGEWSFPWIGRLSKEQCAPVWPVAWMALPNPPPATGGGT